MANEEGTILFENAQLIFKNFTGREGMYNSEGTRNFCVLLDEQIAKQLDADGWNVKTLKPREDEEGEEERPYLQVKVNFKNKPPLIVILREGRKRVVISEDEVETLDYLDIRKVDLIVSPFPWEMRDGTSGIAAYLKSMFVEIEEDYLERKYANWGEDGG